MLLALAVTMVCGTLLVGVLLFVQVANRSSKAYRDRTDQEQRAMDVVELASASLRRPAGSSPSPDGSMQPRDGLRGVAGSSDSWTLAGFTASCVGQPGSGVPDGSGGYEDRRVRCTVSDGSRDVLVATVQLTDERGVALGSSVQIVELHVLR